MLLLRSAGNYSEALEGYTNRMSARAADSSRPEEENPAFYWLLIGDTYLEMSKPLDAEISYQNALDGGVSVQLFTDRIRQLGRWYSTLGDSEAALSVYRRYRTYDEVGFDAEIDETAKAMYSKGTN